MSNEDFVASCVAADIDFVIGVPDSYLAPLIGQFVSSARIPYVAAAREEECLGVAAGLSMCGKRPLALMQNVGFLNSIGCFATLCLTYRTPFLIIVTNRGNLFDKTRYDFEKHRYFTSIVRSMNIFSVSWREFREEKNIIELCYERSISASEPTLLLMDAPLQVIGQ